MGVSRHLLGPQCGKPFAPNMVLEADGPGGWRVEGALRVSCKIGGWPVAIC
jgi:hypothetical protein